jgi:hypothetical protein
LAPKTISLSTVHWSESFEVRNRSSWPRPNEAVAACRSLTTKPVSENQWICVRGACQRFSGRIAVAGLVPMRGGARPGVARERRSAGRLRRCRPDGAPQRQAERGCKAAAAGGPESGSRAAQAGRHGSADGPA